MPTPTLASSSAPKPAEALIRAARGRSNRGIAERNALMVAESLDKDFVVVIGDGTFVPSRDAYIALFKQNFASGTNALTYERIPDTIKVSAADPLAAEHGHWIATLPDGTVTHTGTYSAMWRRTPSGWKLRSELFVTLTAHE
jgi:ketosteroid isomerase-like protein